MPAIRNRWDGRVLYEAEAENLKAAVMAAVRSGIDLGRADLGRADLEGSDLHGADFHGAYLGGAYLGGTDLGGADLAGADLRGACLGGADLRGANLERAYLEGADLRGADLEGAAINWQSHWLVAELLYRAAGEDVERRKIAGLVAVSCDWCWDEFAAVAATDPLGDWALTTLAAYRRPGDSAPDVLLARIDDKTNE